MTKQWILHIDGDGFFAYCEIARFPHLRGKPVVVGRDRGIACAMTYEAKALGITRGMPIFKIKDQFPQVVVLSSHFELYEHYAHKLYSILEQRVNIIERYSIDECFATIELPQEWSRIDIKRWLEDLKQSVESQIGLTYSFGMSRTKVLAKIASKRDKPNGCTLLMQEEEEETLKETPIESVWGIGRRMSQHLLNHRVRTAHDFSLWRVEKVGDLFASPIVDLWYEIRGTSKLFVNNSFAHHKSIQATKSFAPSSTDPSFIISELLHNLDISFCRLRQESLATNSISIYLKTTEYHYHSINISLENYSNNPLDAMGLVSTKARSILKPYTRYKATGITLCGLVPQIRIQNDLFSNQASIFESGKLMETIDTIREKYGSKSIGFLGSLKSSQDRARKYRDENYISGLPLTYLGETI